MESHKLVLMSGLSVVPDQPQSFVYTVPVECKVDLSATEPHVHHVMYVGGCGIPGKVGIKKVLLEVVEVESLWREGVWSCHQVLGGWGWDSGLDLLRCQLRSPVTTAAHIYIIWRPNDKKQSNRRLELCFKTPIILQPICKVLEMLMYI